MILAKRLLRNVMKLTNQLSAINVIADNLPPSTGILRYRINRCYILPRPKAIQQPTYR